MAIARLSLVSLLMIASLGFTYFAANTLRARGMWEKHVVNLEKQVVIQDAANDLLLGGDAKAKDSPIPLTEGRSFGEIYADKPGVPKLGVRQLHVLLHDLLVGRGRVWDQARRGKVDPASGDVSVTIEAPTPHMIKDGSLLYVFEKNELTNPDTPAGGLFLGEFKVAGVNNQSIALTPAQRPSPRELAKIVNSKNEWALYEIMPADRHAAFAGMDAAELAKLIPSSTRKEYADDGQPAPEGTPPELLRYVWVPNTQGTGKFDLVGDAAEKGDGKDAQFKPNPSGTGNYDRVEGKYVDGQVVPGKFYDRRLRDYSVALRELHRQLWKMQDDVLALSVQVETLVASVNGLSGPGGQVEDRDKEIAALQERLTQVSNDRDVVKKHAEAVDARIGELQQSIDRLLAENKKLADEYTATQLEAARRIDALTGELSATR
jgi:hypothetical protein